MHYYLKFSNEAILNFLEAETTIYLFTAKVTVNEWQSTHEMSLTQE